jgi:hypothetical protein
MVLTREQINEMADELASIVADSHFRTCVGNLGIERADAYASKVYDRTFACLVGQMIDPRYVTATIPNIYMNGRVR